VTERPLERAWRTALEEREWEPPEGWAERIRSERRRQIRGAMAVALTFVGVVVLLFLVKGPPRYSISLIAPGLCVLLSIVQIIRVAAGWDEKADREVQSAVRVDHALRSHASVGSAYRDQVTERAKDIIATSDVGLFGWPVLSAGSVLLAVVVDSTTERLVCLSWAALSVLALVASQRRARWARRWLADPLPRS